jgi:DNA-binding transcriptional LysR family regulator
MRRGVGDLNSMLYFAAIVEHGSLASAARALGVPASTLSRKLAQLEKQLGVHLIERTTRAFRLTEAGTAYHERCARLAADVVEADAAVRSYGKAPRGTLRLTAPTGLGIMLLGPPVANYLSAHPVMQADLVLMERFADLREEGFDIAIRAGGAEAADPSYIVRRLGRSEPVLCAAPSYVAKHGAPGSLRDLTKHALISLSSSRKAHSWRFVEDRDQKAPLQLEPRIVTNNSLLARDLCRRGVGLALLPRAFIAEELKAGALLRLDFPSPPESFETSLLMLASSAKTPKVRAFLEVFYAYLKEVRPWS